MYAGKVLLEKINTNGDLIRKNNHRSEKAVSKLQKRLEGELKFSSDKTANTSRLGVMVAVALLGLFQWQQNSTRDLIDRNEERIANLIKENAKLQGELDGLTLYTKTEIQDRKDYSNVNDEKISSLQKKLADDNLKLLELLNKK